MALNPISARWGRAHITAPDARRLLYAGIGPWPHRAMIGAGNDGTGTLENFQVTINEENSTVLDIGAGLIAYHGLIIANDAAETFTTAPTSGAAYQKAVLYIGFSSTTNIETAEFAMAYSEAGTSAESIDYPDAIYESSLWQPVSGEYYVIEQQNVPSGSGSYGYAIPVANVLFHGGVIDSVTELIPLWNAKQFYTAGDSIDLSYSISAGYIAASGANIYFYIPVNKPMSDVSGATLSGSFTIRHADGGFIGSNAGQPLTDLGAVTITPYETGLYVRCVMNTPSALTNQAPISVLAASGAQLTFN